MIEETKLKVSHINSKEEYSNAQYAFFFTKSKMIFNQISKEITSK